VVVLTGSDQLKDVSRAYELGANCYLVKPSDFDDLTTMILSLSGLALDESGP
jgi:DNA-binding NarL/FixJ family response regulator